MVKKKLNSDIIIIGVTKNQPIERVKAALKEEISHLGENYLKQGLERKKNLKDFNIHWHFIGSLQSNKIKEVVSEFEFIHSVCRRKEILLIDEVSQKISKKQKIFLQINIANEESKSGVSLSDLEKNLEIAQNCDSIELLGFMIMPPFSKNPEDSRKYFKQTRELARLYKKYFKEEAKLSMGTSEDYQVAIEEGAHFVRLGRGLFGDRSF